MLSSQWWGFNMLGISKQTCTLCQDLDYCTSLRCWVDCDCITAILIGLIWFYCNQALLIIYCRILLYIYIYIYISDVLLWTPTYGQAKAGQPARTYIQQLCEDTGCNPEYLPKAMNNREKWREMVRDIRAGGTTWWYIYIYMIFKHILYICNSVIQHLYFYPFYVA